MKRTRGIDSTHALEGSTVGRVQRLRSAHCESGDLLERQAARTTIASSLFPGLHIPLPTVGRYQLRRRLGAGGMGIVFAAEDPYLQRELAIKLLHPATRDNKGANEALLTEAQNTARLLHPAVVTVFDAGLHDGRVFVAMELVSGCTMAQWLATRPPWKQAVAVLARAARGIEAAHGRGIIHRDFKPANVLLGADGRVCVADFGLAREIGDARFADHANAFKSSAATERARTVSREVAGTPAYMAPEQYLGMVQDERTDQFAFCVSLYESLWGRRPFAALTLQELREAILTTAPATPAVDGIPRELASAVSRGLSKRRRDRFSNMGELAALLESLTSDVRLRDAFGERPVNTEAKLGESTYAQYLRVLPDGLDTAPDAQIPTRVTQLILAQKPLKNPPPEMIPILQSLYTQHAISAAHTRALMCAFYDEHFASLTEFEAFMEPVGLGIMRVVFGVHSCPDPASPHYVEVLLSVYNRSTPGMVLRAVEKSAWSVRIRVEHPVRTVHEVHRVAIAAVVRAEFLVTGSNFAEVSVVARADDSFELKAQWR